MKRAGSSLLIKILDPPRPHRQRKGRRKPATVLNHEELSTLFSVDPAALKDAMIAAGWQFHEDASGALWATSQDDRPRSE